MVSEEKDLNWNALLDTILDATRKGLLVWNYTPNPEGIGIAKIGEYVLLLSRALFIEYMDLNTFSTDFLRLRLWRINGPKCCEWDSVSAHRKLRSLRDMVELQVIADPVQ